MSDRKEKFTPGPWECETTSDHKTICIGVGMFEVNAIHIAEIDIDDVEDSERIVAQKNARLIASAPELYEALEMAVKDLITAANMLPDIDLALLETAKRAHSVLAKARGE